MRLSQAIKILDTVYKTMRPANLMGPPAIGKSDIVRQCADNLFAEEYGYSIEPGGRLRDQHGKYTKDRPYLFDIRLSQIDPVDLRGIPRVNGDNLAHWCVPDWLPTKGKGVLFLDEFDKAPISVANASLELLLDRRLGSYKLPDGWWVVSAANRVEDRAGGNRLTSAVASRFACHLDIEVNNADWQKWAIEHGIMPDIRAFLELKPSLLHDFDPVRHNREFPSPRTWQFTSEMMATDPAKGLILDLVSGAVGKGAAAEYVAFRSIWGKLPSMSEVVRDPHNYTIPTERSVQFAMAGALAEFARDCDHRDKESVLVFVERLPAEISALAFRDTVHNWPESLDTDIGKLLLKKHRKAIMS